MPHFAWAILAKYQRNQNAGENDYPQQQERKTLLH